MLKLVVAFTIALTAISQAQPPSAGWSVLVSKSGWTIQYPKGWTIGSCKQCDDPTAPNVPVTIEDPRTKRLILIEPLAPPPVGKTPHQWLIAVKSNSTLLPVEKEEWIELNGLAALRVTTRNSDRTTTENTYVVSGQRTFALRSPLEGPSHAEFQRIVSSFRFQDQ